MPVVLPRAILFDLDDTLIRAYAQPEEAWTRLLHVFAAHLDAHDEAAIARVRVAVMEEARAFWTEPSAAARWRLDIPGARRRSVRRALARLDRPDEALGGDDLPFEIVADHPGVGRLDGQAFQGVRVNRRLGLALAELALDLDMVEAVLELEPCDLGALGEGGTVGDERELHAGGAQRVDRGMGIGVVAVLCAAQFGEGIGDAVGQRLGICGIWYDPFGAGVPAHAEAKPARIIKRLSELLEEPLAA